MRHVKLKKYEVTSIQTTVSLPNVPNVHTPQAVFVGASLKCARNLKPFRSDSTLKTVMRDPLEILNSHRRVPL